MQTSNRRRATRRVFRRALAAAVVLGCVGGWAADALAQSSGGSYVLRKHVIGDGGVQASGAAIDLTASAGQVAPGVAAGGSFRATLGFHPAASGGALPLFRDGFE